jgi:hypothetical protein
VPHDSAFYFKHSRLVGVNRQRLTLVDLTSEIAEVSRGLLGGNRSPNSGDGSRYGKAEEEYEGEL